MTLFHFKPGRESELARQWPDVWQPLRLCFYRFCEQCVHDLGTPPIVITCLSRTVVENRRVGGRPDSLHTVTPCRAIDIRRRGFDLYAERMRELWQKQGVGWDFVIEGPHYNRKAPHFHLEADWRVGSVSPDFPLFSPRRL